MIGDRIVGAFDAMKLVDASREKPNEARPNFGAAKSASASCRLIWIKLVARDGPLRLPEGTTPKVKVPNREDASQLSAG
jgi:hypothetical protein